MSSLRALIPLSAAFTLGSAAAVILPAPSASAQDLPAEVAVNPACYRTAENVTLLDEEKVERLCQGAFSTAPVRCYEAAEERTTLDTDQQIRLCRCARSTAPVGCYERSLEDLPSLEEDQSIESCRPIVRRRLFSATCHPREE